MEVDVVLENHTASNTVAAREPEQTATPENVYVQELDQDGYALLQGVGYNIVLTELSVTLGRGSRRDEKSLASQHVDIHLGDDPYISRKHAHIEYDFISGYFQIKCLSKNGLELNGRPLLTQDGFVQLHSKSYVKIGSTQFRFLYSSEKAKNALNDSEKEYTIQPVQLNTIASTVPSESMKPLTKRFSRRRNSLFGGFVKSIEDEDVNGRSYSPVIDIEPVKIDVVLEEGAAIVTTSSTPSYVTTTSSTPTFAEPTPVDNNRNKKRKRVEGDNMSSHSSSPDDESQHEKPKLSFTQIIKMALESSPDYRLSFSEICDWMCQNYPYFASAETTKWHNSVRHQLSTGSSFTHVARTNGDRPGKGGFWMLKEK